jgi:NADH:ubiquinone oxidoreductase subunit F (NADH-binding)
VVNLAEGEPASWKDTALALASPHLVLDGAAVAARALGAREVHVVVPGDRPAVTVQVRSAVAERFPGDDRITIELAEADTAFVAGQSAAVVELLSGRENRPVTTWQPAAVKGLHGRPTLLSNAETFAHVALVARGADRATTLLTLRGDTDLPRVHEVRLGTPWRKVLDPDEIAGPLLLGGYHGTWAPPGALEDVVVSREAMAAAGLTLGAGIVIASRRCPLDHGAEIATYLAHESAGRCGPCVNGLPRLASALRDIAAGLPGTAEVERLGALVERRGACAHPDGTTRMARSLVQHYVGEIALHQRGRCHYDTSVSRRKAS